MQKRNSALQRITSRTAEATRVREVSGEVDYAPDINVLPVCKKRTSNSPQYKDNLSGLLQKPLGRRTSQGRRQRILERRPLAEIKELPVKMVEPITTMKLAHFDSTGRSWTEVYLCEMSKFISQQNYLLDCPSLEAPHQIVGSMDSTDADVCCAIASLAMALQGDTSFAFGTPALYSMSRYNAEHGMAPMFSQGSFIIPVLFNKEMRPVQSDSEDPPRPFKRRKAGCPEDVAKKPGNHAAKELPTGMGKENWAGGVGHFVLAVAERLKAAKVKILFMNSGPEYVTRDEIRRTARAIICHSGWMTEQPIFSGESDNWCDVIHQQEGNTCGVHTILNAWAYMLKVNLGKTAPLTAKFYETARVFINLCLTGCINVATIKAFFHQFHLAKEAGVVDSSDQRLTVFMNEQVLVSFMENFCSTTQHRISTANETQRFIPFSDKAVLFTTAMVRAEEGHNQDGQGPN